MTPKEKAEELVNELFERSLAYHDACIAASYLVEEIIKSEPTTLLSDSFHETLQDRIDDAKEYWKKVESEIGK